MIDWQLWQWLAAIGGAMAAMLLPIRLWREATTHWKALRDWLKARRERHQALDTLIKDPYFHRCQVHQEQLEDLREEIPLLLRANFAIIDGLRQLDPTINGPVTDAHRALDDYILRKAHE